jgi:hypothetical protein
MIRIVLTCLCVAVSAYPQQQQNYIFNLRNGARVLYQVYSEVRLADGDKTITKAEATGDRIRRVLLDQQGLPWLGFEIHIDRVPNQAQFRLSIEPIPRLPFFSRAPEPRVVQNTDRILLDVLENPSTGKRLFDTFQVGLPGSPMQIMPLPRSVPGIPPAGTTINLHHPKLIKGIDTLAHSQSTLAGARVGAKAHGMGEFLFATSPAPGYRMEAIAEGNSIRFVAGSERYEISSSFPVLDRPGSWYLWVKIVPGGPGTDESLQVFVP